MAVAVGTWPVGPGVESPPPPRAEEVTAWKRWLPLAFALVICVSILIVADTPVLDVAKYLAYALLAVMLPGTLVYRSLRRTPHTFVEDLALGSAVGLTLELAAWALFSWLDLRSFMTLWPLLVIVPFAAIPALRRHWRVTGYTRVPLGWSWSLAGVVTFFTAYLYGTFYVENPILPNGEGTRQFVDLAYQLSLAGEAKHHFPLNLPQVAGEPLHYHWFSFVHLAMSSMVGHIDLPVVTMRLMIPAICALTATLTAVAGWRLSGKPYAGVVAAALFFVIGEFNFTNPETFSFNTQVEWIIWPSLSMTYSWALLVALILVAGDILRPRSNLGPRAYVVAALLAFASSGAKASSLPVVLAALAFAGAITLVVNRRIPWPIVGLGAIVGAAQLFSTAVLFHFDTYGLKVGMLENIDGMWREPAVARPAGEQALIVAGVWLAYLLNLQLRGAGFFSLAWVQRGKLSQTQLFLLGGAIAGPALFLTIAGFNSSWFSRAGFPCALLLSGWGYALLWERAALSKRGAAWLGAATACFAAVLIAVQWWFAPDPKDPRHFAPALPILKWAALLAAVAIVVAVAWRFFPALAGRGGLVLLTGILVAGAPGLFMDMKRNLAVRNGGSYSTVSMPLSRIDAARWVRDHSDPNDVIATNVHCVSDTPSKPCKDAYGFWLSAYSERSVLVEGWQFDPRFADVAAPKFWNPALLSLNDKTITDPTAKRIASMHDHYHVRFLVVDRAVHREGTALPSLATLRYDNGRMAVYELH